MAFAKLINLFALSSLAILVCSLGATPASALSTGLQMAHHVKRDHGAIAAKKRKRQSNSTRCRARTTTTSSSPTAAATIAAADAPPPTSAKASSSKAAAAPAATPDSSSSSSSSNSFSNPGSGKVGLGWPNGDSDLGNFITGATKFVYTWSESCPDNAKQFGLQCMPMLWNGDQDKIDAFNSATSVKGYASIAIGFNEVNEAGQANMQPQDAVNVWLANIEPLKDQGYTLLSPSTSSNPDGLPWMQSFFSICNGRCTVHGMTLHYYDITAQGFIDYINLWHTTFNLPVWITEFACENFNGGAQCDQDQVNDFYSTSIDFMESSDFVIAYFPFGFMTQMQGVNTLDQLMNDQGFPTALGQKVIDVNWN